VLASALALEVRPRGDVSFGRVRATDFDRDALDERRTAVPVIAGRPARTMVSCGHAVPGLAIRIVDDRGAELPDGRIGVITLSGSSLTTGYRTADAPTGPREGPHDTGDLGVRHDGELYVVGRTQEMLDADGRRLPPYDIEALIEEHPRVGAGHAAVFGHAAVEEARAGPVVAFVETNAPASDWPALSAQVTGTVQEAFALALADIVVVRRGTIPRTSSGKRRRGALRSAYLEGAAMPVTER
jgi:acyl-coenzyme A synthetase/AMP-(fatty) acid ligase